MYRPPNACGLGNILIHLCSTKRISETVLTLGHRGKFIKIIDSSIEICKDNGSEESVVPPILINPNEQMKLSLIVAPTDYANNFIEKYRHLVDDVLFGFQIRMGIKASQDDIRKNYAAVFCDDTGLKKFHNIMKTTNGNVFIASDCLETIKEFDKMYPDRIRFIPEHTQFIGNLVDEEPWVAFTQFFLLSLCPVIYMTGGAKDMFTFSTFGYTSALYGLKQFIPIFNDSQKSTTRDDLIKQGLLEDNL